MFRTSFILSLAYFSLNLHASETAKPEPTVKFEGYTEQVDNDCSKEILNAGFVLTDETVKVCKQIEKSDFSHGFNGCLAARPNILAFDENFFKDCYQSAQQKKSGVYSQCLNNISKLNIDKIKAPLRELAFQANSSQCYQLTNCLRKSLEGVSDLGNQEFKQCARTANLNLSNTRQDLDFKISLVPQQKKCMYDINRQKIPTRTAAQHQDFVKNYNNASTNPAKHWTTGPCE